MTRSTRSLSLNCPFLFLALPLLSPVHPLCLDLSRLTPNGTSTTRLLFDPSNDICPDFGSEDYVDIRKDLGSDDQATIAKLTASWTKGHDKKKSLWAAQVTADEAAEEARQTQAAEDAAEAAKAAEKERLEEEAKKPKLGDFNEESIAPTTIEARISPYAERKLERKEYCLLYPFTPRDNQLTVQTGPSSMTHKSMVRDDQLTWREFDLGKARFLMEIMRYKWEKKHLDALSKFFYLICNHPLRFQPHGEATLLTYAECTRFSWHQSLGTPEWQYQN
ncbi:hypothetical protein DFH07DRAFT_740692 [Mycena maculata]|uniref:Uncharacterized protein n=1 Tax=Mycena maculata TaxID=230809 RepID=A0AAD7JAE4_9AGAR|nr:hypothetical protein DFH07DRAFT_740692 [Mycena maculata]